MPNTTASVPEGLRIYAIGDIHGRADLLGQLLDKIDEDAKSATGRVLKIFLGDYVDRGLYSREVIQRLIELQKTEKEPPVFLMGNHEQVMRDLLHDKDGWLKDWLTFGGRETLMSYGVPPTGEPAAIIDILKAKVPAAHAEFLENLKISCTYGDYLFCHAGVRPGVPLAKQKVQDLVWIRYEFLACREPFGKIVVHGHTISPEVEFRPNRINIDTGAYATGRLTALGLEGKKQWLLQTE